VTADGARAPLAHRAGDLASLAAIGAGSVEAAEVPSLSQVDVRVDPADAVAAGISLPLDPNTSAPWDAGAASAGAPGRGDAVALWLGPDEWLVTAAGDGGAVADDLERRLAGVVHSVVEVSAARAVVELRGAGRFDLLSSGCPLDLHPRAWRAGRCAQTLVGRAQVVLEERGDATRLFVRPSFVDYLVDWLVDAAGGVGLA
jgi:sarcosine oxidase, subunit gamma